MKSLGMRPAGGQTWLIEVRVLADRSQGSGQSKSGAGSVRPVHGPAIKVKDLGPCR